MARRGGLALAVCAAALLLTGPAVQAAPRAQEGLPGPRPGCPPQQGVVAPAAAPWAQQELGFASVWKRTRGGGVTVAVVDSGVDANPQFGDRVIPGPDLVAGTKPGIPPGADCVGHGTAVASIIAAAPVPGVSFTGVAPAARILSVKISGTDTFPTSVTPQGIMDAVQFGADVINLSLATPDDVQGLRNAVEYALRHNVVVVAAAGNDIGQGGTDANDANDGTGPFYPAAYPGVLAVGAVGPGGVLAGFSDRYTPVGVTAPGVNVTSAYPGTFPAAYDAVQNGTSFAAAFVSGVVALVRSAHPGLNAAQVVAQDRGHGARRDRPGDRARHGQPGPGRDRGAAGGASRRRRRPGQRRAVRHLHAHGSPGGDRRRVRPRGRRADGGAGHPPPAGNRAVRTARGLGPRSRPCRPAGAGRRPPRRRAGPPGRPRASRPR